MEEKNEEQKKVVEKCFDLSKLYCEYRETLLKTEAQLNFRRKQLISELCCIYPVVEVSCECIYYRPLFNRKYIMINILIN